MKRILLVLAFLALPFVAGAQLVQSSSMVKVKTKTRIENIRQGWSVAASISGGDVVKGAHSGMDLGAYADGGYHFNSWLYLGATLGASYWEIPDASEYSGVEKKLRPQFMINPRFYFFNKSTSPFIDFRGGVNLTKHFYGRLELLAGCVIVNHFEVAIGVCNNRYAFGDNVFKEIRTCYRAGYRFYF